MYTVLVGSVAKGEDKLNSDIDIVRISHNLEVLRMRYWPSGPVNYIDYSESEFMNLYEQGSLFIYHMLNEGKLIHGDKEIWNRWIKDFRFIDNYGEELDKIRKLFYLIADESIYGGTYLSFYSNLFILIKNYAIYYLAHNGIFEFNKEKAYKKVFGSCYYNLLCTAYNIFERDECYSSDFQFDSRILTEKIIEYFKNKLEVTL